MRNLQFTAAAIIIFVTPLFPAAYSLDSRNSRIAQELDKVEYSIVRVRKGMMRVEERSYRESEESSRGKALYSLEYTAQDNYFNKKYITLSPQNGLNHHVCVPRLNHKDIIGKATWGYPQESIHPFIGLQTGYIKGYSKYHISFSGGASELEFPLNTYLAGVIFGLVQRQDLSQGEYRAEKESLSLSWFKDIGHTGKMQDSDWIDDDSAYGLSDHPGKDIYSQSSSDINLDMLDFKYIYNFLRKQRITIGGMLGYKYDKYSYKIYDTNQVGIGPYDPLFTVYVPGASLNYQVRYRFFYFGANSDLSLNEKMFLHFQFGYSPWVRVNDLDDHLLRYKLSKANTCGDAYFLNVNGRFDIVPNWYLGFGFEYTKIDTKGIQYQSFYAGPSTGLTAAVDDKITAGYWSTFLSLNYTI